MKASGVIPPMPPTAAPHIVARLIEIGPTQAAGMGVAPISWGEIAAWCDRTGIDLSPWEGRLIRQLSVEYIAWTRQAENETCPPPWRSEVTAAERNGEEAALRSLLG